MADPVPGNLNAALAQYQAWLRELPSKRESFDAFCARHPALRKELCELHALIKLAQAAFAHRAVRGLLAEEAEIRLSFEEGETVTEGPRGSIAALPELPAAALSADGLEASLLSHYTVEGELARGGMGAIYKVRDRELNRTLAMKVMLESPSSSSGAGSTLLLRRFLEEVQVTAQLDHPGIVAVHELGLDPSGRPYFTMKLVKGRDLSRILELARTEEEGWNLPRAAGALIKACQAVAFAHTKGVIHRDLKPSNIMVGRFGEVYVMDWGLAKVTGRKDIHDIRVAPSSPSTVTHVETRRDPRGSSTAECPLITMDGSVVGTPAYMPPEQAKGQIDKVDALSDVYSLGGILYHLLSGRAPYVEPDAKLSPHTILARVLDGPPKPIAAINPGAPPELVAICEKAMAREKSQRYASCLELAEDLQAWLDHRVVKAYRAGAVAELKSWVMRNRSAAIAGASAVLILLLGAGTLLFKNQQIAHARQSAESNLYASLVREARAVRHARRSGYRAEVFEVIGQARALNVPNRNLPELRSEIVGCLGDFVGVRPEVLLSSANLFLKDAVLAPSGRVLAIACNGTNIIRLREVPSGKPITNLLTEHSVWSLCFDATGRKLITVQGPEAGPIVGLLAGAFVQVWTLDAQDHWIHNEKRPMPGAYKCFASEQSECIALAEINSRSIKLLDLSNGAELHRSEYPAAMPAPPHASLSPDGKLLAIESLSRSGAGALEIWDLATSQQIKRIEPDSYDYRNVNFSSDGKYLALLCQSSVSIYSTDSFERLARHQDNFDFTFGCAFAAGRVLIVPSKNLNGVRLWDWSKNEELAVLHEPDWVTTTLTDNAATLLLVCTSSKIAQYPLGLPDEKLTLRGPSGGVPGVAFSPNGSELASLGQDQTLRIWDPTSGALLKSEPLGAPGQFVTYSPNGNNFATTVYSTELVDIWDTSTRKRIAQLGKDEKAAGYSAQFSPDGRYLVTGSAFGTNSGVRVWTNAPWAGRGPAPPPIKFFRGDTMSVVFAPNRGRFAFLDQTGNPGNVYVWDVDDLGPPRKLAPCFLDTVHGHSFTLDGTGLITVDADRSVVTIDVATGEKVRAFPTTNGRPIEAMSGFLVLSPDGKKLAFTSMSEQVDLWEPDTGRLLYSLPEQRGRIWWMAWNKQSDRLAVARSNGDVSVWKLSEIERVLGARDLKP